MVEFFFRPASCRSRSAICFSASAICFRARLIDRGDSQSRAAAARLDVAVLPPCKIRASSAGWTYRLPNRWLQKRHDATAGRSAGSRAASTMRTRACRRRTAAGARPGRYTCRRPAVPAFPRWRDRRCTASADNPAVKYPGAAQNAPGRGGGIEITADPEWRPGIGQPADEARILLGDSGDLRTCF